MRVYLAGPIQHLGDHGATWRNAVKNTFDDHDWVDPIDNGFEYGDDWEDHEVVDADLALIDECDALLVNYEEAPLMGTPREIGYVDPKTGRGPNIPIVARTDVPLPDLSPWLTDALDATQDVCRTTAAAVGRLGYYENRWQA